MRKRGRESEGERYIGTIELALKRESDYISIAECEYVHRLAAVYVQWAKDDVRSHPMTIWCVVAVVVVVIQWLPTLPTAASTADLLPLLPSLCLVDGSLFSFLPSCSTQFDYYKCPNVRNEAHEREKNALCLRQKSLMFADDERACIVPVCAL